MCSLQVLSKGTLRKSSSVAIGDVATIQLNINPDMIPSFRLIGYYYNTHGEIIADSIWIDVKDVCEGKVSYILLTVLFLLIVVVFFFLKLLFQVCYG